MHSPIEQKLIEFKDGSTLSIESVFVLRPKHRPGAWNIRNVGDLLRVLPEHLAGMEERIAKSKEALTTETPNAVGEAPHNSTSVPLPSEKELHSLLRKHRGVGLSNNEVKLVRQVLDCIGNERT